MAEPVTTGLTMYLAAAAAGDSGAAREVWALIYDELRGIARRQLAAENGPRTLQPTALVNEAYLRLLGGDGHFANRRHFFAAAANVMRQIRVDDARKRDRIKRGGGNRAGSLDGDAADEPAVFDQDHDEVLAVHEAMAGLEAAHPEAAEVVALRYFTGLSIDETAEAIGLSPRKVDALWALARSWLKRTLSE